MDVLICKDEERVGEVAASLVVDRIRNLDEPVIGLATGGSPVGLYRNLQRMVEAGELDLSRATGFALDEYVGLSRDHPQSYHQVIRRTVVEPLRMNPYRVHVPDGLAGDLEASARAYGEAIVASGGIDVQILGIGANAHIAFNEPFSPFGSRPRVVPLTEQTRRDNSRFFSSIDEVPAHAVTQGLSTILESKALVLVAFGEQKAEAISHLVEGAVAIRHPATILQWHEYCTVVIDEAAASKLRSREHFSTLSDAR